MTYKEAKHHELHKMRACFVDIEDKIKDEWSEYDKMVARTHLENYGQIIIDEKFRTPIDNEHDLYVISGLIRAIG